MKKIFKTSIFISALISLIGCSDNLNHDVPADGVFNLGYSVDNIDAATKVIATDSEKLLNEAYLIFYQNGAAIADQTYVAHQMVTINNNATSFPMPIPEALVPNMKYKVLIVANYDTNRPNNVLFDDFITNLNNGDRSYSSHKNKLYSQTDGRLKENLPFFGTLLEIGDDSNLEALFTCPNATTTDLGVKIIFKRSISRFDLVHNAADKLHIETVKVCNYRDRGYFYHSDALLGSVVSGIGDNKGAVAVANPAGNRQIVRGGLYGYPNVVPYTAQGDKFTTCLMIGGYYQTPGEAANTTKLSYYRANISLEGSPQLLRGNNVYSVTINDVTGEGSTDEGGAIVDTDNKLDYESGGDWEDGDGGTNIDGNGNFVIVSRVNVMFNSAKDLSETVNVKVKDNAEWTHQWIGTDTNADFKVEKLDGKSLKVSTKNDNTASAFTKNAKLRIKLVALPNVFVDIDLIQLPSSDEIAMLSVDGKIGTVEAKAPGQGGEIRYSVLTGSSSASWTASDENSLSAWASFTPAGSHNGFFNIVFKANLTGRPRSGHIIIRRSPDVNGGVEPVRIEFMQTESNKAILIYTPQVGNIEGYRHFKADLQVVGPLQNYALYSFSGGLKQPYIPYTITLANSTDYTWSATINVPLTDIGLVNDGVYSTSPKTPKKSSASGASGESVLLFVQNTAPGDPNINATLTIKAIPKGSAPAVADEVIPIVITTSCDIDYVIVNSVQWDDRNQGPSVPAKYNDAGVHTAALHYTSAYTHVNQEFKGALYNFAQAESICKALGWRLPDATCSTDCSYMLHSKSRPFLPSQIPPIANRYDGCFFNYAITTGLGAEGNYIYDNIYNSPSHLYLHVGYQGCGPLQTAPASLSSLRCVRDAPKLVY